MSGTPRCKVCRGVLVRIFGKHICPTWTCERYGGPGRGMKRTRSDAVVARGRWRAWDAHERLVERTRMEVGE